MKVRLSAWFGSLFSLSLCVYLSFFLSLCLSLFLSHLIYFFPPLLPRYIDRSLSLSHTHIHINTARSHPASLSETAPVALSAYGHSPSFASSETHHAVATVKHGLNACRCALHKDSE